MRAFLLTTVFTLAARESTQGHVYGIDDAFRVGKKKREEERLRRPR